MCRLPEHPSARSRLAAALAACVLAAAARAQQPAAQAPTPPAPPAEAAPAAAPPGKWSALAGWGYYEVTHVGFAYRPEERAAFSLFGGYGPAGDQTTWTVGGAFSHALFGPVWSLQPGWVLKAVWWSRSDPDYDWKNLSVVLGAYLEKDLGRGLRVALDGGVALSGALQSDRKQDFDFGSPTRWNGSVCVEISYRLGTR